MMTMGANYEKSWFNSCSHLGSSQLAYYAGRDATTLVPKPFFPYWDWVGWEGRKITKFEIIKV